jgi:hypothetical protein
MLPSLQRWAVDNLTTASVRNRQLSAMLAWPILASAVSVAAALTVMTLLRPEGAAARSLLGCNDDVVCPELTPGALKRTAADMPFLHAGDREGKLL